MEGRAVLIPANAESPVSMSTTPNWLAEVITMNAAPRKHIVMPESLYNVAFSQRSTIAMRQENIGCGPSGKCDGSVLCSDDVATHYKCRSLPELVARRCRSLLN